MIDAIDLDFSGNIVPLPVSDGSPSVRVEYRCMSSIKSEVERLIKEGTFNYRTPSQFHRHADWNQLLFLKEMSPAMKKRMRLPQLFMATIERSEKQREHGTMIAYLNREVDALKTAGDTVGAKRLVFELMNLVADYGSNGDWERETMKYIRLRHADLLAMGLAPNGHE